MVRFTEQMEKNYKIENEVSNMSLSKRMKEAISLLEKEEFYLCEFSNWNLWRAYNLPGQTIRTDTMKALEKRGIVEIQYSTSRDSNYIARLIFSDYEEISAGDYCIRCDESYQNNNTLRWICRRTGKIVVDISGRSTVNAMKCNK